MTTLYPDSYALSLISTQKIPYMTINDIIEEIQDYESEFQSQLKKNCINTFNFKNCGKSPTTSFSKPVFFNFITSGKYDIGWCTQTPSLFWTNRLRSAIYQKEGVNDLFTIPACRVKSFNGYRHTKIDFRKYPYVANILIQPKNDRTYVGSSFGEKPTEVSGEYLETILEKIKKSKSIPRDAKLEIYMTYTNHRIALKVHFMNPKDIIISTIKLREALKGYIESTTTIVGMIGKMENWVEPLGPINQKYPFLIFIKTKSPSESYISKALREVGCSNIIVKGINNQKQVYGKAGHWDFLIIASTNKFEDLFTLGQEIRLRKEVLDCITIPLIPWNIDDEINEEFHDTGYLPGFSGGMWREYERMNKLKLHNKARYDDSLYYLIFNLRENLIWLFDRTLQVRSSWLANPILQNTMAFNDIIKEMMMYLNQLSRYLTRSPEELERMYLTVQDRVLHITGRRDLIKEALSIFIGSYNEKCEISEISTLTEPYLRFGDRTGVFDLLLSSLDKLMRDYVGLVNQRCKNELVHTKTWEGISVTSHGQDLNILTDYQTIQVPADIKYQAQWYLNCFAREAAHFLKDNIQKPLSGPITNHDPIKMLHIHYLNFTRELFGLAKLENKDLRPNKNLVFNNYKKLWNETFVKADLTRKGSITDKGKRMTKAATDYFEDLISFVVGGPPFHLGIVEYFNMVDLQGEDIPILLGRLKIATLFARKYPKQWKSNFHSLKDHLFNNKSLKDKRPLLSGKLTDELMNHYYTILQRHFEYKDNFEVPPVYKPSGMSYSQLAKYCKDILKQLEKGIIVKDVSPKYIVGSITLLPLNVEWIPSDIMYQSLINSKEFTKISFN